MLFVGCLPIVVGLGAAALARWRREPLGAVLAHDSTPAGYQGPVEVAHNEAVAALGDRGKVRPPR